MKVRRERAAAGQESVWDYPRPPRVEPVPERIRIVFNRVEIADTCGRARTRIRCTRSRRSDHVALYPAPMERCTVRDVRDESYSHHITRLMVLSNLAMCWMSHRRS